MRPQDWPGSQLKMLFFSTEIDGSGWPLVFWIFDQTEPSPVSEISIKFFKVFQGFSEFFSVFKVFQCFSGCFRVFSFSSDEGLPPRPFHGLVLVKKGGSYF